MCGLLPVEFGMWMRVQLFELLLHFGYIGAREVVREPTQVGHLRNGAKGEVAELLPLRVEVP